MLGPQRVCYLHIGTRKTSTTSIQSAFAEHRAALEEIGVCYPRGLSANQRELAFAAGAAEKMVEYRPILGSGFEECVHTSRAMVIDVLDKWLARPDLPAIVFSAEDLSKLERSHIYELKALFDARDVEVKVLCYLRRQYDYVASNVSTIARNGGVLSHLLDAFSESEVEYYRLNYRALLEDWAAVFGWDSLAVGLYEESGSDQLGIVARVMEQVGLAREPSLVGDRRENAALNPEAIAFLLSLNKVGFGLDPTDGKSAVRWKVEQLADAVSMQDRRKWRADRTFIESFERRFAESNEWVRENVFPDLAPGSLFADVPAASAADAAIPLLLGDEQARFSAQLIEKMIAALQASEGKSEYLWGRMKLGEKQPAMALVAFERALEYLPSWHVIHYYRAHALYQLGRIVEARDSVLQALALDKAGDFHSDSLLALIEKDIAKRD